MKMFVLFDLGNTLVSYYEAKDFPPILQAAIGEVERFAEAKADWGRVQAEKHTAKDFRVTPLEERLSRIFKTKWDEAEGREACRRFMRPIFSTARLYDDVMPTLAALRER